MDMDVTKLIAGGGLLAVGGGIITTCWGKIKVPHGGFAACLFSACLFKGLTHKCLMSYLVTHYKRSPLYDKLYTTTSEHSKDGKYGLVAYETMDSQSIVFRNGIFPVFVSVSSGSSGSNPPTGVVQQQKGGGAHSTITFIRWTFNVEKVLIESVNERNDLLWDVQSAGKKKESRFQIYYIPKEVDEGTISRGTSSADSLPWYRQGFVRLLGRNVDDLGRKVSENKTAISNLIFPKRVVDLIEEVKLWRSSKQWYKDRCIPWKRGWLLYGSSWDW